MSGVNRYQRGQAIPVEVVIGSGMPLSLPVANITDPDNALFDTILLPYLGLSIGGNPSFGCNLRMAGGTPLGTYQVAITYTTAAGSEEFDTSFVLVAGGDSGGEVISMFSYERPEARYLLAQLATGKLVQGKNPHL